MTLPADTARCPGVNLDGQWREGCESCARRTATGEPMEPPKMITLWCEFHIPERDPLTGDLFGDSGG